MFAEKPQAAPRQIRRRKKSESSDDETVPQRNVTAKKIKTVSYQLN